MNLNKLLLYLFALTLFGVGCAFAQPCLKLEKGRDFNTLINGESFSTYSENSKVQSFKTIASKSFSDSFKLDGRTVPLVNPKQPIWVRLNVCSESLAPNNYLLELVDGHIEEIQSFVVYPDGVVDSTSKFGYKYPFSTRPFQHKNFVTSVNLQAHNNATIYFRINTGYYNVLFVKVQTTSEFTHYSLNEYLILGLYYGIILLILITNFFALISLKEKLYLYYILYVTASALISLMIDGFGFQYLWPNSPNINTIAENYSGVFQLVCFFFFSRRFLELQKYFPLASKALTSYTIFYVLFFLFNTHIYYVDWSIYYGLSFSAFIYVMAILSYRAGVLQAKFFLAGFSFAMLGTFYKVAFNFELVNFGAIFNTYSFNFGVLVEIVFFSYALADRLKVAREEQRKAKETLIENLKENQRLKDVLNKELEEMVNERTKALNNTNLQLEVALVQVQEQAEEIDRINQLLYVENDELKGNIKSLTRARVMHKEIDIDEFRHIFPSPDECFKYLIELKWKGGFQCRKCGNNKISEGKDALSFRCSKCRYEESPTTNTIFHKVKFPINKAFEILFLVYSNRWKITSTELSEILQLRQKTCWSFVKKLEVASDIWVGMPGNKRDKMEWDSLVLVNLSEDDLPDDDG